MTAGTATTEIAEARPNKRRSRWQQFSLRTLLLAMLVLSVCFALFAFRLQRARRQATAVATIRKLGGSITYDYQRDAQKSRGRVKAESPMPVWLVTGLRADFCHEGVESRMLDQQPKSDDEVRAYWSAIGQLRQLELFQATGKWVDGTMATEAVGKHRRLKNLYLTAGNLRGGDLAPLAALSDLEILSLDQNPIGDDGAEFFGNFPRLECILLNQTDIGDETAGKLTANKEIRSVQIDDTQITDAGIAKLATLPNLKGLKLGRTAITDDGLRHVAKLRELVTLTLPGTKVSDAGVAQLAPLVNLRHLELAQTQVTGSAFESLQSLTKLETLMLDDTKLTNEGAMRSLQFPRLKNIMVRDAPLTMDSLGRIKWPKTLEVINLGGTGLTDDGLMRLAGCPKLRFVISGTKVTPEGIKRFQQALPGVQIH